jgi:hypothetical protein
VIVFYPALLVMVGAILFGAPRPAGADRGSGWFMAWTGAGSLFMFSFLSGFSIGLFLLPAAAALLLVVAWRCPHEPERAGFAFGVGVVLLLTAGVSYGGDHGSEAAMWFLSGAILTAAGLGGYALADRPYRA